MDFLNTQEQNRITNVQKKASHPSYTIKFCFVVSKYGYNEFSGSRNIPTHISQTSSYSITSSKI